MPPQMTRMLDLMMVYLEAKGEQPFRIDGTVPWQERQENMNKFNNDPEYFVFLLSTRAGGLGINLVAADTVGSVASSRTRSQLLFVLTRTVNPWLDLQ